MQPRRTPRRLTVPDIEKPPAVAADKTYPIQPHDLSARKMFDNDPGISIGKFGKAEVEVEAWRLVQYFQHKKKGWVPFTLRQIRMFYKKKGWGQDYFLQGLIGPIFSDGPSVGGDVDPGDAFVIHHPQQTYSVTTLFVERCKAK